MLYGCAQPAVVIYAPGELAGASVVVDGRLVGHLSEPRHYYKWVGWTKLRGEVNSPPRRDAIGELVQVAPGEHELRIEKPGYKTITRRVHYAGRRIEVEIADNELNGLHSHASDPNNLERACLVGGWLTKSRLRRDVW